ncbi:MAG: hypothetical protein ACK4FL_02040 [Microgenomates group bacterium]
MPDNQQGVEPFRSASVYTNPNNLPLYEEDPSVRPRKAYFFNNNLSVSNGATSYTVTIANIPGAKVGYTACYNDINCHNQIPIEGNNFTVDTNKVDSQNFDASDPFHYVDLWWHFTPQTPNCKDLNAPDTVFVNDQITLSAIYEKGGGGAYPVTSVGMVVYDNPGGCDFTPFNETRAGGPGIHQFNWTPATTGQYTAFCRAWNDAIAECRADCVDGPPRYLCLGPNGKKTITVQNPGPWYKLKDASLNKIGAHNIAVVQNIKKFTDVDTDDTTNRYVIISSSGSDPGVLLTSASYSPGPPYNPIPSSNKNWYGGWYGSFSQVLINQFADYAKSRKETKRITNLSQIESNFINLIDGNQTINNSVVTNKTPFVLIVNGNVTVNENNFNNQTNNSLAIIANTLTFSNTVQVANGIFIANQIYYQNSDGLKIIGNLVSQNAINLQSRPDNARPSLFVVFKPKMYLDLLPYLSISKYDWRQIQ